MSRRVCTPSSMGTRRGTLHENRRPRRCTSLLWCLDGSGSRPARPSGPPTGHSAAANTEPVQRRRCASRCPLTPGAGSAPRRPTLNWYSADGALLRHSYPGDRFRAARPTPDWYSADGALGFGCYPRHWMGRGADLSKYGARSHGNDPDFVAHCRMAPDPAVPPCPVCGAHSMWKWGFFRGRRRFRCRRCHHTHTAPPAPAANDGATDAASASFRRWILTPVPVRQLAASAGLAPMTVMRWRRRVLVELRRRRVRWCGGDVEMVRLGFMDWPWSSIVTAVDDQHRATELWLPPVGPRDRAVAALRAHIEEGSRLTFHGPRHSILVHAATAAGFCVDNRPGAGHPPRARARAVHIRKWVARFSGGPHRDPFAYLAWYDELHGRPQPPFPLPTPKWYSADNVEFRGRLPAGAPGDVRAPR
jgi:transposase-like protein